jgi:hypothetical protein
MAEQDRATKVALRLSDKMGRVSKRLRDNNPVGFGKQLITTSEYRKRWLGMTESERNGEIERQGLDVISDRLSEE